MNLNLPLFPRFRSFKVQSREFLLLSSSRKVCYLNAATCTSIFVRFTGNGKALGEKVVRQVTDAGVRNSSTMHLPSNGSNLSNIKSSNESTTNTSYNSAESQNSNSSSLDIPKMPGSSDPLKQHQELLEQADTIQGYNENNSKLPDNFFTQLEKAGVIEYNDKHQVKLSPEAREIYRALQEKPRVVSSTSSNNITTQDKYTLVGPDAQTGFTDVLEKNKPFVGGALEVEEESTALLTPIQSHLVVGVESVDETSIEVVGILTSDKGMQAGIAGCSTTTKISDEQHISSDSKKAQFVRNVEPHILVSQEDFKKHEKATEVVNRPDISSKLEDFRKTSYEPVVYDRKGITLDTLQMILDTKEHMMKERSILQEQNSTNDSHNALEISEEVD